MGKIIIDILPKEHAAAEFLVPDQFRPKNVQPVRKKEARNCNCRVCPHFDLLKQVAEVLGIEINEIVLFCGHNIHSRSVGRSGFGAEFMSHYFRPLTFCSFVMRRLDKIIEDAKWIEGFNLEQTLAEISGCFGTETATKLLGDLVRANDLQIIWQNASKIDNPAIDQTSDKVMEKIQSLLDGLYNNIVGKRPSPEELSRIELIRGLKKCEVTPSPHHEEWNS